MFMRELATAAALVALCGAAAAQQSPNLGKAISPEDLATWDISIGPDVAGLPSHCQGIRKRVSAFGSTGSESAATPQLLPPSADTSTLAILP